MIITFEFLKNQYEALERAKKLFPQLEQYERDEIDWNTLMNLDLCALQNSNSQFGKGNIELLTGERIISFTELKELMLTTAVELLPEVERAVKGDWQECDEELVEYKESIKIIESLTEETLIEILSNDNKYREMVPYLWRAEIDIMYKVWDSLANWVIVNGVDVKADIAEFEGLMSEVDVPGEYQVEDRQRKINNSESLIETIISSIKGSNEVDYEYFQNELKRKLDSLNREEITRAQKINEIT